MSDNTYKAINQSIGKALHEYNMISDGDKIAVGLSGGKDSLALMWTLQERLSRIPVTYELFAVYIDPGFKGNFNKPLQTYCDKMGYSLRIEPTDHGLVAHSDQNRENPCFLCSKLRRKRLFEIADELGCSKLALGHHKDDIIETLFLNILYAGEISTMSPAQPMFNGKFTIIRPLAYVDEDKIIRFAKDQNFPVFKDYCPTGKISKRKEIKDMLNKLYKSNPKIKGNIFRSMRHVKTEYLLK